MLKITNSRIEDIAADIIVNAADMGIWFGSGVDGSLRQRGGWPYIKECQKTSKKYAPIEIGDAVIMRNKGNLQTKYVIHASSPSADMDNYRKLLVRVVKKIIKLVNEKEVKSVAIPLLGSGVFGISKRTSKKVITDTLQKYGCRRIEYLISIPFGLDRDFRGSLY